MDVEEKAALLPHAGQHHTFRLYKSRWLMLVRGCSGKRGQEKKEKEEERRRRKHAVLCGNASLSLSTHTHTHTHSLTHTRIMMGVLTKCTSET